jgi:L-lactate dehydrogenase complex protein LldG
MPDDREAILSRVRGALAPLAQRAALPNYDTEISVMRKLLAGRDLVAVFAERLKRVNGQAFTDPAALVAHLRTNKWLHGYCDPTLWPSLAPAFLGGTTSVSSAARTEAGPPNLAPDPHGAPFKVETEFDRTRVDDYAFGITRAAGAIAESGTIVLNDATTSRRLAALAPWTHVAVVERSSIFADLPEAVAALGADRNVIWATGPSKTADVEGILIEGVHGPGAEIALIV